MLVGLLVEIDMFSVSPIMDWKRKKKTLFFDIKCHDSYLMKCLHNNINLAKMIEYVDTCT